MGLLIFLCCLIPTIIFAVLLFIADRKYNKLQKENDALREEIARLYYTNSERLAVKVGFEPECYRKDQMGYSRAIAEKAIYVLMNTMVDHAREKLMAHFIKCMAERKYFWENDVFTMKNWVYISVPVYRLDYGHIQVNRDQA